MNSQIYVYGAYRERRDWTTVLRYGFHGSAPKASGKAWYVAEYELNRVGDPSEAVDDETILSIKDSFLRL